jgi:hypothetical protein
MKTVLMRDRGEREDRAGGRPAEAAVAEAAGDRRRGGSGGADQGDPARIGQRDRRPIEVAGREPACPGAGDQFLVGGDGFGRSHSSF